MNGHRLSPVLAVAMALLLVLSEACGGGNVGGSAAVTATFNTFPELTCIEVHEFIVGGDLSPNPSAPENLPVGVTADVVVTAKDPDQDPLTYAYTSNCSTATFTTVVSGTPNTARFYNPDPATSCTVTVAVSDGRGGTASAEVAISGR